MEYLTVDIDPLSRLVDLPGLKALQGQIVLQFMLILGIRQNKISILWNKK